MRSSSRIGIPLVFSSLALAGAFVVAAATSVMAAGNSSPMPVVGARASFHAAPVRPGGGNHVARSAHGGHRGGFHHRGGRTILTPGYVPVPGDGYPVAREPVQQQVFVQPVVTQTQIVNQPYYAPLRVNCTRPRIVEVRPTRKTGRRSALPRVIYGSPDPCL